MSDEHGHRIASRYRRFAEQEARGRSALYETLAQSVARDPAVLGFLASLPREKQQPNLLFAVVRHQFGVAPGWPTFRGWLLDNTDAIRTVMLARSTQTNEPARCATLLPVLARLPQPLALIEVGASAGLCLLPDRYGYDYGGRRILPDGRPDAPVFTCAAHGGVPVPTALPRVVWRAGLDFCPIDVADPAQTAWLEALVWPEQDRRLANLRAALAIAAEDRPRIVQGDLRGGALERLCGEAPEGATLVCFHTAVLAYVTDPAEREAFGRRVMQLCPYWVANESPGVLPGPPIGGATDGRFLLSVNGSPAAWTDPHGAAIEWIGFPPTHGRR